MNSVVFEGQRFKRISHVDGDYFISKEGKIYSKKSNRLLKTTIMYRGYETIPLRKNGVCKNHRVHRLVLITYDEYRKGLFVNHKDGNKLNNNLNNLEWVTHIENIRHAQRNNLYRPVKGEDHTTTSLTNQNVLDIVEAISDGFRHWEIAEFLSIQRSTVSCIANGISWSWLTGIKYKKGNCGYKNLGAGFVKPRKIRAENLLSNSVYEFKSVVECADFIGFSWKAVYEAIKRSRPIRKKWKISTIYPEVKE